MRFLVRQVILHGDASVEHRDADFSVDSLTIGRGTDQSVQLPGSDVDFEHATIRGTGDRFQIVAPPVVGVMLNGSKTRNSRVQTGDVIEIGAHKLTVTQPPFGFDFAISVELGEVDETEEQPGTQFTTTLAETKVSKRKWSWMLAIGTLIAFLALPVAGLFNQDAMDFLRSSPLPSDGAWDSGTLTSSHQIPEIGDNCEVCHVKPFVMVENQQCTNCHKETGNHVDTNKHHVADLDDRRCESCHKEHGGVEALLVSNQGLCADCHADIAASTDGKTDLKDVANFSEHHPEFALSMLVPKSNQPQPEWETQRITWTPKLQEKSNLKFPHSTHLDAEGIKSPTGDVVLACKDCHAPESDGGLMQPISMERHCRSCHTLSFDENAPDRQVPHGDSNEVMQTLQEFYSRKFLTEALAEEEPEEESSTRRNRRPGNPMRRADRLKVLERADDKAREAGQIIFERTNCVTCHEISFLNEPQSGSNWQVHAVKLAKQWYEKSIFPHVSHRTIDCTKCHDAEKSEVSSDVLMPGIENCRECHADKEGSHKVATGCIGCHNFHLSDLGFMQ